MAAHHPFGPSSLYRRILCPGSWKAEANIPEPPQSQDARLGSAFHAAMAKAGISAEAAVEAFEKAMCRPIEPAERVLIGKAMEMEVKFLPPSAIARREETLSGQFWFPDTPNPHYETIPGTPDLYTGVFEDTEGDFATRGRRRVAVLEWKFGMRSPSALAAYSQLTAQAAIIALANGYRDVLFKCRLLHVRSGAVVDLEISGEEAIGAYHSQIVQAVNAGDSRWPGLEQCCNCRALSICPQARELHLSTVISAMSRDVRDEELDDIVPFLRFSESWCESMRSRIREQLAAGRKMENVQLTDAKAPAALGMNAALELIRRAKGSYPDVTAIEDWTTVNITKFHQQLSTILRANGVAQPGKEARRIIARAIPEPPKIKKMVFSSVPRTKGERDEEFVDPAL